MVNEFEQGREAERQAIIKWLNRRCDLVDPKLSRPTPRGRNKFQDTIRRGQWNEITFISAAVYSKAYLEGKPDA